MVSTPSTRNYWLFKSEPFKFSWDDMKKAGTEPWDGIRNYQARNNMRAMNIGDYGFFYHSNEGLNVVGVVEVVKLTYPDHTFTPTPGKQNPWEMVDVKAVCDMPNPVTLKSCKVNPALIDMPLVSNGRLSVQPVTAQEWQEVCRMGGLEL